MKHFIYTIIFLISSQLIQAQEVNQISLEDLPAKYIVVEFQPKTLFTSSYLLIDYGQVPNLTFGKKLKDLAAVKENNEEKRFNSEIEALNFLASNGYKLIESFQNITTDVDNNVQTGSRKFLFEKIEFGNTQ